MGKKPFYSFFRSITQSFGNKALYQDIALNWSGKCINHLWSRIVISWIIIMIILYLMLSNFLKTSEVTDLVNSIPLFKIKNNNLILTEKIKEPYILRYNLIPIAIIDTTGTINSLENRDELILFTKNKIISKNNKNDFPMKMINNIELNDRFLLLTKLRSIPIIIIMMLFPFAVLIEFLIRMIEISIFSVWIKKKFKNIDLSNEQIFRLCSFSLTPGMIFSIILWGPSIIILRIIINLFIDIYYVNFAIKSSIDNKDHLAIAIKEKLELEQKKNDDDIW